jgi:hypothetical protein
MVSQAFAGRWSMRRLVGCLTRRLQAGEDASSLGSDVDLRTVRLYVRVRVRVGTLSESYRRLEGSVDSCEGQAGLPPSRRLAKP